MSTPVILIFNVGFSPSVKWGGPARSLENLMLASESEFSYFVVTSDRDYGEDKPYDSIDAGSWAQYSDSNVYYINSKSITPRFINLICKQINPDLVYFNSFWNVRYTIIPVLTLLWRRCRLPLLIAPRGEFNPGALSIKSWKKSLYFNLIGRFITRSKYVFWHGTNNDECKQLNKLVKNSRRVFTARNIPSVVCQKSQINDIDSHLRIVSVGRVCEMKNIDFALRVLHEVKCPVTYDIIGNIEDANYWSRCSRLIDTLPPNVTVNIVGPIEHDDVVDRLGSSHLFFSPTQGENFGHAIVEALQMGCPVLISDMTPWVNLEKNQAGWDLPLSNLHAYATKIEWLFDNKQEFRKLSVGARNFAKDVLEKLPSVSEHVQMFERVLEA